MIIENEFKCMLSPQAYHQVWAYFDCQKRSVRIQTNTYYDTAQESLKQDRAALRLRNFATTSEWTLKVQVGAHQSLERTQPQAWTVFPPAKLDTHTIYQKDILDYLQRKAIALTDLHSTFQLTTYRYEILADGGRYCLDRTLYGKEQIEDYELEWEFSGPTAPAQETWLAFLDRLKIPYQAADKKIARAAFFARNTANLPPIT